MYDLEIFLTISLLDGTHLPAEVRESLAQIDDHGQSEESDGQTNPVPVVSVGIIECPRM